MNGRASERETDLAREAFDEALYVFGWDFGVTPTTNGAKVIAQYLAKYRDELSYMADETFNERIIELECALKEIEEKTQRAMKYHDSTDNHDVNIDIMYGAFCGILLVIRSARLG